MNEYKDIIDILDVAIKEAKNEILEKEKNLDDYYEKINEDDY